jgi:hypothetical protein
MQVRTMEHKAATWFLIQYLEQREGMVPHCRGAQRPGFAAS